jgi:hypothetical protein
MSEPDAVPLPREGEVFFDVRGESRTMRLSWYADSSVAVFSIWQGNRCTGTFRLPFGDLVRMVETLEAGPPSLADGQGQPHQGESSYANAGPGPGYGYPEPARYGPTVTYAHQHGYGQAPNQETAQNHAGRPGYEYGSEPGYEPGLRDAGGGRYGYEPAAASRLADQGYGPLRSGSYAHQERYGAEEYDTGPRYVPDVAANAGPYQHGGADYRGPGGDPLANGYERAYAYGASGYQEQPSYAGPRGYDGRGGYPQRGDYGDEYAGGYRGETHFLAAPPAEDDYAAGPQAPAWRDERPRRSGDRDPGDFPARQAKTEQAAPDWGPATASYRTR